MRQVAVFKVVDSIKNYTKIHLFFYLAYLILTAGTLEIILQSHAFAAEKKPKLNNSSVEVSTKMSLIHVGSNDSFNPTSNGIRAGRLILDAIQNQNIDSAKTAIEIYDEIVPRENFGGEYTALKWFAECLIASDQDRNNLIKDPFIEEFYSFFSADNHANLKEYLRRKYKLSSQGDEGTLEGEKRKALLEDTILFNNPRREQWEKTSEFLKIIKLPEGAVIADVGAGPGYYSTKLAKIVGNNGKVFAIDTVDDHLNYIKRLKNKLNLPNITPILADGKTIGIPGIKVDAVILCSLYHNIYGMSTLSDRDQFVESIKKALKDEGRLYLFDNGLVPHGTLPYHGPYVAQELVIGQLQHYGFKLVSKHQPVQQRYALVFEKNKALKQTNREK